jgi:drug/metabolite transporter (DMT)-like permease
LVTTLLSLLLLHEILTPTQSMGAVVMLVSLGVFQLVKTR